MAAKSMPKRTSTQREFDVQIALAGNSHASRRAAVNRQNSNDSRGETLLAINPFRP
jgi:hypothetical protein